MTKRNETKEDGNGPDWLTVDEAADVLRVDRNSLYAAIKAGQVPGVFRIGRLIRIRKDALGPMREQRTLI